MFGRNRKPMVRVTDARYRELTSAETLGKHDEQQGERYRRTRGETALTRATL